MTTLKIGYNQRIADTHLLKKYLVRIYHVVVEKHSDRNGIKINGSRS